MTTTADVLAARRGDSAAFRRLVEREAAAVCALTTAIAGSPSAGEEVAQEVFVLAWQDLARLREPDRFGPWVRGIARNRAREAVRASARRKEIAGDALGAVADPAPDASDRLDAARRESALWSALDDLDESHREVLVLYYREGRSVEQVARVLDLPEPAVRKRLSRARERLRDDVADRLGERIARTAPRPQLVAGAVAAAIVLAPRSARAAPVAVGAAGLALVGLALFGTARLQAALPDVDDLAPRVVVAPAGEVAEPGDDALEPVPAHVVRAFLAAEDARFFEHGPFDVLSLGRAVAHDLGGDGELQGGSTLTQQLAKRLLADRERSVQRKVLEAFTAWELERRLDKAQILALYLDGVYLGAGAYGLDEASRLYFDEGPEDLTLGQGALLAGIPAHPEAFGPFADPVGAAQRRARVLDRMEALGWATASEVAAAKTEPVPRPRGDG